MLIAEFLKSGSYDRHLRKLRNALKNQMENTLLAVTQHFPKGTKSTTPQGGIVLWIELDSAINGLKVYQEAIKQKISIIPGCVFSNSQKFQNYIRLSYGSPWNEDLHQGISTLGKIISNLP